MLDHTLTLESLYFLWIFGKKTFVEIFLARKSWKNILQRSEATWFNHLSILNYFIFRPKLQKHKF